MADMTITITVSGRAGGNNISWSRTGTITDLLGAVHRVGDIGGTSASSETGNTDGIYSTGAAVLCVVHSAADSLLSCSVRDGSKLGLGGPLLPSGIPMIVYNGAGAGGFNGGMVWSPTNTDTPTTDIDSILLTSYSGLAPYSALTGLKLIS